MHNFSLNIPCQRCNPRSRRMAPRQHHYFLPARQGATGISYLDPPPRRSTPATPARARCRPALVTSPPFAGTRSSPAHARRRPALVARARRRRLQSSLARPRRRPGFVPGLRLMPARPRRRPALVARAPSRHRSGLFAGPGSSPARDRRRPAHGTPVTHARSQALVTFSPNASAASPLPSHKTSSPQPRNLQRGFFRVDSTPAAVAKSLTLEARPCCT